MTHDAEATPTPTPNRTTLRGVRYVSMHDDSGYGIAAQRAMRLLRAAGVPVTWVPMVRGMRWALGYEPYHGHDAGDAALRATCNRAIPVDLLVANTVPEYYPHLAAQYPGVPIVGSTVWETTRVPRHWPALLAPLRRIIVPTAWNRDILGAEPGLPPIDIVAHALDPYAVAPHALDPNAIDSGDTVRVLADRTLLEGVHDDDFVFYTIGMWSTRKAVDLTLEAYLRAFTAQDRVVLVIKTSAADMSSGIRGRFRVSTRRRVQAMRQRYRNPPRVVLQSEPASPAAMHALHSRGDCYVSLSRAEGWGLGAYDAAARGRPVIMTAFGGQRDFLPAAHATLVNYALVPVVERARRREYSPDQQWAEPEIAHAVALLRATFADRDAAKTRGAGLGAYVRDRFDDATVSAQLVHALERAVAGVP